MTADIHLHIERLVVDREVLDGTDPELLAAEVSTVLHGILESRRLAEEGSKNALRGDPLTATGALGAQIAGAVHARLAGSIARTAGHRP